MKKATWAFAGSLVLMVTIGAAVTPLPLFEPDPLWSQALPNKWVTGAIGGTAVDSHDNVWVFHREGSIPDGEKPRRSRRRRRKLHSGAAVLEFSPAEISTGMGAARGKA